MPLLLRQYDLGHLTLGIRPNPGGIAISQGVNQFSIDAYCPIKASQVKLQLIFHIDGYKVKSRHRTMIYLQ